MKILDNILVILSNYTEQLKTIEALLTKVKYLEEKVIYLESIAKNFDEEIENHKNNIEKLYEINIKILSAIKPKKNNNTQQIIDERKNKEHIN